jgi:hypothetical protein
MSTKFIECIVLVAGLMFVGWGVDGIALSEVMMERHRVAYKRT